jgi:hypothetical protein
MSEPVTTEPLDPVFEVSTSKFHVVGKLSKDRIKLFVDIELLEKGKVTKAELEELLAPKVDIQLVNAAVLEDIAKHLPSQKKNY